MTLFLLIFSNLYAEKLFWRDKKPLMQGLKSFVIPGWGQISNHKYIKGALFFTISLSGMILNINEYNDIQNTYGKYEQTLKIGDLDNANILYKDYQNKYILFQYTITSLAIFWLINTADAIFDAHFMKVDLNMEKKELKIYLEKKF